MHGKNTGCLEMKIRKAAVAGMFYPYDKEEIEGMIDKFLKNVPSINIENLKALIVPHAGYIYSGPVAGKVFSRLKLKDSFLILGPNHTGYGKPFSIMRPIGITVTENCIGLYVRWEVSLLPE